MTKQNLDRLKFEWFELTTKIMYEVISLDIKDHFALVRLPFADEDTPFDEVFLSDGVLRQSTGLKDKNGKEIYEGDITDGNGSIEWCNTRKGFVFNCDGDLNKLHFWEFGEEDSTDFLEVIGNIYENPELLNN